MISKLRGINAAALLLVAGFACAAEPAQLVKTVCGACHSLEIVTKKQATKDEWRDVVEAMVARGADLKAAEVAAVTDYLAANYGKPDRARELVESVCILCHEFARVKKQELSKEEWAGVIKGMLAEGAPLTDEEFEMVVGYLAKTYGVKDTK